MKRYLNHKGQAVVALLCCLMLVFSVLPVHATDETSLTNKTSDLQNQLTGINQELVAISDKVTETEQQVIITNSEIMRTQDSLATAEADEAKQYEDMKTRIKYMYETGNASLLEMLFSAEDMTDFLNKADFIQNISNYDRNMLLSLQETQRSIAEKKESLDIQHKLLEDAQKDLEGRKAELSEKAAATSTDLNAFNAQLQQLRADQAAQLAAETAAMNNKNTSITTGGGSSAGGNTSTGEGGYDNSIVNGGGTNVSADELDVFAAILQLEAYQNYEQLLAVATVIMNRVNDPRFPNSITDVVYAPNQFAPVQTGALDSLIARGPSELSYQVAQDAINGSRLAAVQDCYYFLYEGAAVGITGVVIGGNIFFRSW